MDHLMPEDKATKVRLASIKSKLDFLGSPSAQQILVKLLAETAKSQVDFGFRTSTSPWGFTWAPLKFRIGGKPLQDTRKHLQSSIGVRFGAGKFRLFTKFIGAAVHQYGATIRPVKAKALRFGPIPGSGWTHAQKRTFKKAARSVGDSPVLPSAAGGKFVYAQKVVIPAREYLPVGSTLPDRWAIAFKDAQRRFLLRVRRGEFDNT